MELEDKLGRDYSQGTKEEIVVRVSLTRVFIMSCLVAAFAPMASAVQLSGSSAGAAAHFDVDEDVYWISGVDTIDAVIVGDWVWTYLEPLINQWGYEPAQGAATGGTSPGLEKDAFVRAENNEEEAIDLTVGWSFDSAGAGGSDVVAADFAATYTVKLKKLVVDYNGSTTTYTSNLPVYTDSLTDTMSLPQTTPPSDGAEFTPSLDPGEYYKLTATGATGGSWTGQNQMVNPTHHKMVGPSRTANGVQVEATIEIDIAKDD